jgi:hypothetical protein
LVSCGLEEEIKIRKRRTNTPEYLTPILLDGNLDGVAVYLGVGHLGTGSSLLDEAHSSISLLCAPISVRAVYYLKVGHIWVNGNRRSARKRRGRCRYALAHGWKGKNL